MNARALGLASLLLLGACDQMTDIHSGQTAQDIAESTPKVSRRQMNPSHAG